MVFGSVCPTAWCWVEQGHGAGPTARCWVEQGLCGMVLGVERAMTVGMVSVLTSFQVASVIYRPRVEMELGVGDYTWL